MTGRTSLKKALLDFLDLECPPLLFPARKALQDNLSPSKIENILRFELNRLTALPEVEAGSILYPGTIAIQAALWYREYLEEVLGGFFRRWEIRNTITEGERLQMYR